MIIERPKNFLLITFMDALLIAAPLLILFLILLFDGQPEVILSKSEWSFVTVFYLIEVLRNQVSRNKLEGYAIEQVEAGTALYAIVLIIGVLVLATDYRNSIGEKTIPLDAIYILKFSAFLTSLTLFIWSKFKRYKLQDLMHKTE